MEQTGQRHHRHQQTDGKAHGQLGAAIHRAHKQSIEAAAVISRYPHQHQSNQQIAHKVNQGEAHLGAATLQDAQQHDGHHLPNSGVHHHQRAIGLGQQLAIPQ